jgi:pimeloyl-ACP methyl ester carboxylesterase
MGAAATMMYMIAARLRGDAHHVRQVVLLSPAGVHRRVPRVMRLLALPLYLLSRLLRNVVVAVTFPSEAVRVLVQKLMQDVRSMQGTRDLLAVVLSGLILGRAADPETFAFSTVPSLTYNIFAGTSMGVLFHVFQWYWNAGRFTAFDYGVRGNRRAYGRDAPPNFLDYFSLIDVPVHFVCGTRDRLIPPENVRVQYDALHAAHPELAHWHAVQMGHIDFTYGFNTELLGLLLHWLPARPPALRRSMSVTLFDADLQRLRRGDADDGGDERSAVEPPA